MSEKNYVTTKDYKSLCQELKDSMDKFLELIEKFDDDIYYDMFD